MLTSSPSTGSRRLFRVLVFSLTALPIAGMLVLAILYALDAPVADYWDILHQSYCLQGKGLTEHLKSYWEPFVDQRMFFPKVLIDRLAQWTGNHHYSIEIALGFGAQLACLWIIAGFFRRSDPRKRQATWIWIVLTSWLLFWPALLERFQHHWYSTQYSLVVLPGLMSLRALQLRPGTWRGLGAAAALVAVAALSHGTGVVLVLAVAIAILPSPSWSWSQKLGWCLLVLGLLMAVRSGIPSPQELALDDTVGWWSSPLRAANFFFACLGPPGTGMRRFLGLIFFSAGLFSIWVLLSKGVLWTSRSLPWLVLFTWGVGVAAITTHYRWHLGNKPAAIYYSFFVLFPIGVLGLAVTVGTTLHATKGRAISRFQRLSLYLVIVVVAIYPWVRGSITGIRFAGERQEAVAWSWKRLEFAPLLVDRDYLPLFPQQRFLSTILPDLVAREALPSGVDLRPFDEILDVGFRLTGSRGIETRVGEDGTWHFRIPGGEDKDAFLEFAPSRPIPRDCALVLDLSGAEAVLTWRDESAYRTEASLALEGRYRQGHYWAFFRGMPGDSPSGDITAFRLHLTATGDGKASIGPIEARSR